MHLLCTSHTRHRAGAAGRAGQWAHWPVRRRGHAPAPAHKVLLEDRAHALGVGLVAGQGLVAGLHLVRSGVPAAGHREVQPLLLPNLGPQGLHPTGQVRRGEGGLGVLRRRQRQCMTGPSPPPPPPPPPRRVCGAWGALRAPAREVGQRVQGWPWLSVPGGAGGGGGGGEWQPGLLCLTNPPPPTSENLSSGKKLKFVKSSKLDVDFRYTNFCLASDQPPPPPPLPGRQGHSPYEALAWPHTKPVSAMSHHLGQRCGGTMTAMIPDGLGQGCIRREGTSEVAPEAVRQVVAKAVGGGYCQL